MTIEIRTVRGDDDEVSRVFDATFGEQTDPEERESERPLVERARMLGAFEGDQLVGVAGWDPFEMSVPGGRLVPTAAVIAVGTLPTHRRRGVMRQLLTRQLDEFRDGGFPVAALWASEAAIYQRFGYGPCALTAAFRIERSRTGFLRPIEPRGRMRLVQKEEALKVFPSVYERVLATRPAMPTRDDAWWQLLQRDIRADREGGGGPPFRAVYEADGAVDGYVNYRMKSGPNEDDDTGKTLVVEELMAATDDAYAALWRYCFDVDLVREIRGWKRPVDEPLLVMLEEPRALHFEVRDGTWARIVDARRALEGRGYGAENRVVLELRDEFCPWNQGRYEVETSAEGGVCRPTDRDADLALGASELAGIYFGGVRASTLARAGRVEERRPGAVERADAMFASERAPWSPHVF